MNKRQILLATRAEISDSAARTLLEIMLHVGAKGEIPSLTDLTRYRGKSRSIIQNHITELKKCGILVADKLVDPKEGYGKSLRLSEDGMARANGFSTFNEVDFEKFIDIKAGNVTKSTTGESLMPVAMQAPREINTPQRLMKYFQLKYQERYKKEYLPQSVDRKVFDHLIKMYGKSKSVRIVEMFFEHNHRYRCEKSPRGLLSIKKELESYT